MPLTFGILTVSDRSFRGERPDVSGPALAAAVRDRGWVVSWEKIVPDEKIAIRRMLTNADPGGEVDVLLTTGGTGFAPRDITPEATRDVIERETPGLAEAIRAESLKITPFGMLSRGVAGIRGKTLIVNLSGSPKAAVEQFSVIAPVLQHGVELLQDDPEAEKGHR